MTSFSHFEMSICVKSNTRSAKLTNDISHMEFLYVCGSEFVCDSCCCCIPLKTGCLILGYMQLVASILYGLYDILEMKTGIAPLYAHTNNEAEEEKIKNPGTFLVSFSAVMLVLIIIGLPFTILLLVGLHKEIRKFVKYYLVFVVVNLVLHVILMIAKFAGGYASVKEAPSAVMSIILSIYFSMVLRSQYIKMSLTNNVPIQHYRDGQQLMNTQKD